MKFHGLLRGMAVWGLATMGLLGPATVAFGVRVEVTREVKTTGEFTTMSFRSETEEMVRELEGYGCLRASVSASVRPDKPDTMVIVVECTQWRETTPYAPAKERP